MCIFVSVIFRGSKPHKYTALSAVASTPLFSSPSRTPFSPPFYDLRLPRYPVDTTPLSLLLFLAVESSVLCHVANHYSPVRVPLVLTRNAFDYFALPSLGNLSRITAQRPGTFQLPPPSRPAFTASDHSTSTRKLPPNVGGSLCAPTQVAKLNISSTSSPGRGAVSDQVSKLHLINASRT